MREKRKVDKSTQGNPFPLDMLNEILVEFQPPEGDFDPNSPWKHTYETYSVGESTLLNVGEVTLERSKGANEKRTNLSVAFDKYLEGQAVFRLIAKIVCNNDTLLTPIEWEFTTATTNQAGELEKDTVIRKSGTLDAGIVTNVCGGSKQKITAPSGSCATNWSLFAAVQSLPKKMDSPIAFSLLDDFDMFKKNHKISSLGPQTILLGPQGEKTRSVETDAFLQAGDGISPTVYWRDKAGRLLLIVAGLEVYLWKGNKNG